MIFFQTKFNNGSIADISKKCPLKNYRGGYGDCCSIPGCQSVIYYANRVKSGIALFNLSKVPSMRVKWLKNRVKKLLKDTGLLEDLINSVKHKKSRFENFILTQSKHECHLE